MTQTTSHDSSASTTTTATTERSRSQSHHRHSSRSRRHRYRSRFRFKLKERNFIAAVCSMMVIVTLATAMAEPDWIYLRGGGCRNKEYPVHYLGVFQFFHLGHFERQVKQHNVQPNEPNAATVYHFSSGSSGTLIDCVTPKITQILTTMIAMCFCGVFFSLIAFLLDLSGPSTRTLKFLRRNAVFNILTVVICVTINGFTFLVTQLVESLQKDTKLHVGSKVEVKFAISFYLVAAAGAGSVLAAACNLLRRYPPHDHEHHEHLLDNYEGMDANLGISSGGPSFVPNLPPPPAYAP